MKKQLSKIKNVVSSKKKQQIKSKIGKPPGTLIYVGEREPQSSAITVVEYNQEEHSRKSLSSIEELSKYTIPTDEKIRWIDVNGLSDVEHLSQLGTALKIHPLILEDVANTNHQPKVDYYDDDIFLVMKRITWDEGKDVKYDQVAILLRNNLIITFRDEPEEKYTQIHQRIETGKGMLKKSKADYLFYVILDYIIDGYFLVIEELGERIETQQERLLNSPGQDELKRIQLIKKDAYKIKHAIRPLREAVASIIRQESDYIAEPSLIYFRDALDHVIQVNESLESQRESITTLIDIYLSSISNRMNEVMKVLTIMASIFIPLTFIAGVYGMNFSNMPELHYKYGYFIVWGVMIAVGLSLVVYFKRKKWL